ncbi:hypothetical protein BJ085DRAFT_7993, partial [Dimargaris cristalligena]
KAKVGGSKMIRYRCSLNHKLCRLGIILLHWHPDGKPKLIGSGGSIVARLKLKGIDGRA